jgi:hypothetical protein
MHITRIYSDAQGTTHFDEIDVPVQPGGPIGQLSALQPATGIIFRETGPDYDYGWHTAPHRQYVIMLDGSVEIEVGDGEVRRFGAGAVLLLEDTTGRGHWSRAVDGQPRRSIFVTLD